MTTSTTRGEFTHGLDKPFSVTLWGSNPDETDNDDCWTGADFATRDEALACGPRGSWEFVMIDGPHDTHEVTRNPDRPSCERWRRELEQSTTAWRRERAMEAGMLHGVEAYNDAMGY